MKTSAKKLAIGCVGFVGILLLAMVKPATKEMFDYFFPRKNPLRELKPVQTTDAAWEQFPRAVASSTGKAVVDAESIPRR